MSKIKIYFLFISILILNCLFLRCSNLTNNEYYNTEYNKLEYNIYELPYDELPYVWKGLAEIDNYPMDSSGVLLFQHDNQYYYHPVNISQKILVFIDSYIKSQNPVYLDRAKLFADKLKEISIEHNGALYFPYPFDWNLHGIPGETMIAPWYSGMAQGQILSAFVRLFKITSDSLYFFLAKKTFHSFYQFNEGNQPWVVFIDDLGYYWIEEYPTMLGRTKALNGFIFAMFGLYDYYLLTKDNTCKLLLQGALTTIQKYISEYRNPGDLSFYCLRHKLKYANYHIYHTEQLNMLYKITKDEFFSAMFINFYNDYH